MQIIQFSCAVPETADGLKALMTSIVNKMSRLDFLANDPDYVTEPFSVDGWMAKDSDPDTYWTSWDAVYSALGDHGRELADLMVVPFIVGNEFAQYPGITLEIVEVADPVSAGYLPAQEGEQ